jgi:site-specific DNA-methyltransferase (adenine-specific)
MGQEVIRDKQLPYVGISEPKGQSEGEPMAKTAIQSVEVLQPADVLETLRTAPPVQTVILDPWYNKGVGGYREDYDEWLSEVIASACRIARHVFVWGFPEIVAHQIPRLPETHGLVTWLTWYYKNCPSVIRGWRSAQNSCLHLASSDAEVYPEHFLTDDQLERLKAGKMRFIPGPPSVLEAPLNIGFVGKSEQTGHPAQKPLSVFEPLILMSTKRDDTVLDPMCGSGTTGEACVRLGRRAMLCDESQEWLDMASKRLGLD